MPIDHSIFQQSACSAYYPHTLSFARGPTCISRQPLECKCSRMRNDGDLLGEDDHAIAIKQQCPLGVLFNASCHGLSVYKDAHFAERSRACSCAIPSAHIAAPNPFLRPILSKEVARMRYDRKRTTLVVDRGLTMCKSVLPPRSTSPGPAPAVPCSVQQGIGVSP